MSSREGPPRPPAGLLAAGRSLWLEVLEEFDASPAERRILEEACRTADECARMSKAVKSAGLTVEGSAGQPRPNPLFEEARKHRAALAALLKALEETD